MKWSIFICILVAGSAVAQQIPVDELSLPSIDDFAAIKERCDTKGGEGTYDKVAEAKDKLQTCITDMFNVTQIKLELEEKAKTGSMDEVFGKYCNKRPELTTCVNEFTDAVKPCLEDEEKSALNTTLHILRELGDFACYRDGDRLAMFVAEGGVECLRDHTEGIQKCAETTFKDKTTEISSGDAKSIPSFLFNEDRCDDFTSLRTCVVEELEKCEESTPANIVDAVFKFIKKQACKSTQRKRSIYKRSAITDLLAQNSSSQTFLDFMKKRCKKYGTPNSYENVEVSFQDTLTCLRTSRFGFAPGSDQYKEKVHNCMRTFLKNMKVCLAEEEQYIGQFYIDMVDSFIDFMMEKNSEMHTQSFSMEMVSCFQNYRQNNNNLEELRECFSNDSDTNDDDLVTKKKLCQTMDKKLSCLKDSVEAVCIRDIEINTFMVDLKTALYKPCVDQEE